MIYKKGNYLQAESGKIKWAIPVDAIYKVEMNCFGTPITGDSLWKKGVIYYEDTLIPVYDIQGLLCGESTRSKGYVICSCEGELLAFAASELRELRYISKEEFQKTEPVEGTPFLILKEEGPPVYILLDEALSKVS